QQQQQQQQQQQTKNDTESGIKKVDYDHMDTAWGASATLVATRPAAMTTPSRSAYGGMASINSSTGTMQAKHHLQQQQKQNPFASHRMPSRSHNPFDVLNNILVENNGSDMVIEPRQVVEISNPDNYVDSDSSEGEGSEDEAINDPSLYSYTFLPAEGASTNLGATASPSPFVTKRVAAAGHRKRPQGSNTRSTAAASLSERMLELRPSDREEDWTLRTKISILSSQDIRELARLGDDAELLTCGPAFTGLPPSTPREAVADAL
ncbi:hypothetical protein EV182_007901, partial [Spiromyces aspiralis]